MLALSIKQPWAWLIINGFKQVENRTWHTSYRGPFLIHTGKGFDRAGFDKIRVTRPDINMPASPKGFVRGGIVGEAVMVDCVSRHESEWFVGPYGFIFENIKPLPFYSCKGQLGWFQATKE